MNRMEFVINRLEPYESKAAVELFSLFLQNDGKDHVRLNPDYIRKMLARNDFHVFVAKDNNEIVGGLTAFEIDQYKYGRTELFLYEIEVKKEFRKRGIGTALLEEAKRFCMSKEIPIMFVFTSASNLGAITLYRNTGGKEDADGIGFTFAI